MRIETHCPDGTDPQCFGTVMMELPYTGLSATDVHCNWNEKDELESLTIYPPNDLRWIAENERWLSESEIDSIKCDGYFEIEHSDFSDHNCCGACGSSESYNAEGENITAL
jgi:hypothetical protein